MQTLPISERPPPEDAPGVGDGAFLRQVAQGHRAVLAALLLAAAVPAVLGVVEAWTGSALSAFARALAAARPPAVEGAEAFGAAPALGALAAALARVPPPLAAALWALLSLASLVWTLRVSATLAAGPSGRGLAWLAWLPAVLCWWPLAVALREGAPEPLLVLLALLGVQAASRSATAGAGGWLGIASALHPATVVLVVQQAARREWSATWRALALALILCAVGTWVVGAEVAWERMRSVWGEPGSRELFVGGLLVACALAFGGAPRGSAPMVREAALALCALAPWIPAAGAARGLWLLFPLTVVLHTALDPAAPRGWRVLAGGAGALAGSALLLGPLNPDGAPWAALILFLALLAERALQGTNWSRYQPGRK